MATSTRKYTDEQIRFVLVRWSSLTRGEIVAQYIAKYGSELPFTDKNAKYIKDSYAGHPRFSHEFGHLRTERQIQNGIKRQQEQQAKQNPSSVSASQGNLSFQNAKPATASPGIGGMLATPSSSLGGVNGGRHFPTGTINAVGLGLLNTPVSRSIQSTFLLTQPVTPLPSSPTPASFAKASLNSSAPGAPNVAGIGTSPRPVANEYHSPGFLARTLGVPGAPTVAGIVTSPRPPANEYHSPNFIGRTPSAPGTPRQSAGTTTSHSLPSGFSQAQSTEANPHMIQPTNGPLAPSTVLPSAFNQGQSTITSQPLVRPTNNPQAPSQVPQPSFNQAQPALTNQSLVRPTNGPQAPSPVLPSGFNQAQSAGANPYVTRPTHSPQAPSPVLPSGFNQAQSAGANPYVNRPTHSPQAPSPVLPSGFNQVQSTGANQSLVRPTNGPQAPSPVLPSGFNQAQSAGANPYVNRPTHSTLAPSAVQAGQLKAMSSSNVSTPPSHIRLPFDKDGGWYHNAHDGCHIRLTHRHNNDGTILYSTMNSPTQRVQGNTPPGHIQSPVQQAQGIKPPSHIQLHTGDFVGNGVWYNTAHDGCRVYLRHCHNNDGTISYSTTNSPIQQGKGNTPPGHIPSPIQQAKGTIPPSHIQPPIRRVQGSTPPRHIELPIGDFVGNGVWYNTSHDGCPIDGRHFHANDGTILSNTGKPLIQGAQGTKRRIESISQNTGSLETQPRESIQASAQRLMVTHPTIPLPANGNSKALVDGPKVNTQPNQQARHLPNQHASQHLHLGSSSQPRINTVDQTLKKPSITIPYTSPMLAPAQGQQLPRRDVNQSAQLGSLFQAQNTIVAQPAKGPIPSMPNQAHARQSPSQSVNQSANSGSPFQARNTAAFQPVKGQSVTIPTTSSMPGHAQQTVNQQVSQSAQLGSSSQPQNSAVFQPVKEHGVGVPPLSSTPGHAQQPANQQLSQPVQLGSPFQPQNTAVFQPAKEHGVTVPPPSTTPGHAQQPLGQHVSQPAQLGSPFQPQSTIAVQPSTEPSVTIPPALSTLSPATATVETERRAPHEPDMADPVLSAFLSLFETPSPIPVPSMELDVPPLTNTDYDNFYRLPDAHGGYDSQEFLYNTFVDYPWTEPMFLDESPIVDVSSRNNRGSDGDRMRADVALNTLGHSALQQSMGPSEGEPPTKKRRC